MAKHKQDPLIQAIVELKVVAMGQIVDRPATYHALDVASKIAGWELAAKLGDKVDMFQKTRRIYLSAAGEEIET